MRFGCRLTEWADFLFICVLNAEGDGELTELPLKSRSTNVALYNIFFHAFSNKIRVIRISFLSENW